MGRIREFCLVVSIGLTATAVFCVGWLSGRRAGLRLADQMPGVYEMGPELEARAREMFAKYERDLIKERMNISICENCVLEVDVIGDVYNSTCGFVKTSMPISQFWARMEGVTAYRFEPKHIFVLIDESYINKMEREVLKK